MLLLFDSCKSNKLFLDTLVAEEQTLIPTKITDETQTSVVGNGYRTTLNLVTSGYGGSREKKLYWDTGNRIAISPDGTELAYISLNNNVPNIMVKRSGAGGASTQRSFRRAQNVDWASDNQLYFNDNTGSTSTIGSVDSKKGSLVKQITSNNNDWSPSVTKDGKFMYFTRFDNSGPYIWSINLGTGELTNCAKGFDPIAYSDDPYKILCTRNSTKGNSEIWMLDLKNGNETLLLADQNKGFSDPCVSPDGEWILVVGNSLSSITKKQNTYIYAVKMDGSGLTQITYHPEIDCSPKFSSDGKYIYFISSRANKDRKYAIWRIQNPLR